MSENAIIEIFKTSSQRLVLKRSNHVFVNSRQIGIAFLQKQSCNTDKDQHTYCSLILYFLT